MVQCVVPYCVVRGVLAHGTALLHQRAEIVGGAIFASGDENVTRLRAIVVNAQLEGRGLNAVPLEDFCRPMADQGVRAVRTFFFARGFFMHHGFRVDRWWGGLVRMLRQDAPGNAGREGDPPDTT